MSTTTPSKAQNSSNGITYATGFRFSPGGTCIANATCYTPQGSVYSVSLGQTSSFTGLNFTNIYNSRLQPLEFKASSTGGNAIDITYSYADPLHNNKNAGHIFSITNNLNSARTQSFTYDQVNRITSAGTFARLRNEFRESPVTGKVAASTQSYRFHSLVQYQAFRHRIARCGSKSTLSV